MKNVFNLMLLVVFTTNSIYGQVSAIKGNFEFSQSLPDNFSPQLKSDDATSKSPITEGHKINVLCEKDNMIYYKYLEFSDANYKTKFNNGKVFTMPKIEFEQYTIPLYKRYKGATVGAYSIPFRLRGIGTDTFDFESSLSLQANLVFGFGSIYDKESWFDASIGIGVTGVSLNAKNSKVTEDRTASALTLSLGSVIKPAKYANIGVFLGWDFLGLKDKEVDWVHNGQTWLGLGLNISFNQIKTEKSSSDLKN